MFGMSWHEMLIVGVIAGLFVLSNARFMKVKK